MTEQEYKELKQRLEPCPVCGIKPWLAFVYRYDTDMKAYEIRVHCNRCGISGPVDYYKCNEDNIDGYDVPDTFYDEAFNLWNNLKNINSLVGVLDR